MFSAHVRPQNLLSANTTSAHTNQINDAATALYVIGYVTALPLLAYPIIMAYKLAKRFAPSNINA